MSLAKLGAGGAGYYLDQVAAGAEEYYTGSGEAPGRWMGDGTAALDLAGTVDAEDLRSILCGLGPSGERIAAANRKVPGFDLTFSAPKSVSLLYALGGRDAAHAVVAAHDTAVAAALSYLERQACVTRRGRNGVIHEEGAGFVAAGFRHRTSRAGDPQLHTHVLIANLTQGTDGRWRTLDARALYRQQRTAGFLYRAQLRAELTRSLGVDWQPAACGTSELAGVSEHVIRVFSQRRRQILEHLARRGERGAKAAEIAALETRQAKQPIDLTDKRADWLQRSAGAGMPANAWSHLLAQARKQRRRVVSAMGEPIAVTAEQLGSQLTERDSTFARRDVVQALAEHARHGADIPAIEHAAERFLVGDAVSQLGEDVFSTPAHLEMEHRVLDGATSRRDEQTAIVPESIVAQTLAKFDRLSDEQQAMVRRLTTGGHGVDVVVGHPGSGKTTALAAAHQAWSTSGHHVIGAALAARAAQELQQASGVRSMTLTALLTSWERERLPGNAVVIIDEAGMVGTRTLDQALTYAQRDHAKLVLVGDPKQLPEIDAGGAFRALARQLDAIRLVDNRRQRDPIERKALRDLRAGRVDKAMARMNAHGRITRTDTVAEACRKMIDDWTAARASGDEVLLLAARRKDVALLNRLAQRARVQAGELAADGLVKRNVEWRVGDRVMALLNDRRIGVLNGQRGTITAVDGALTVHLDTGPHVLIPVRYIERGNLQLGYAATIHKSQGATTDRSLVLATDDLGYEAGYTALTRGRDENHLYLIQPGSDLEQTRHLRRSASKHLTHERPSGIER